MVSDVRGAMRAAARLGDDFPLPAALPLYPRPRIDPLFRLRDRGWEFQRVPLSVLLESAWLPAGGRGRRFWADNNP